MMALLHRLCSKSLLRSSTYQQYAYVVRSMSKTRRGFSPLKPKDESSSTTSMLLKSLGFTVLVGGVSFGGCAIWQYESLRKTVKQMKEGRRRDGNHFVGKAGSFRDHINYYWNNLLPGQKAVAGIIGINVAVFLAWKTPAFKNVMTKYFVSSPFGKAPSWSMLFSSWSHYSGLHIFVNMYVLWSCASFASEKEQFVAFYTTAGVFSAFTSYLYKIATKRTVPSLGASGALLAVLGAVATQSSEARFSIAFVDQIFPHSFSAKSGIIGIMCLDTLGLILRWRLLDHAAHLGGVLFGIWYVNYGHKWIWGNREGFLKAWHSIRGKP